MSTIPRSAISNQAHQTWEKAETVAHNAKVKVIDVYDDAEAKVVQSFNRLKRSAPQWNDHYSEQFLKGLLTAVGVSAPAFIYRPFKTLQVLQILDSGDKPKYDGYVKGFKRIIREDGFWGLYKGGVGQCVYEVIRFGARIVAINVAVKYLPNVDDKYLPFLGATFVAISDTIGYPISTACTRLIGQTGEEKYKGVVDCLGKIQYEDNHNTLNRKDVDLDPFKPVWYAGLVPHIVGIFAFAGTEVLFKYLFDKALSVSPAVVYQSNNLRIDRVPWVNVDFGTEHKPSVNFGSNWRVGTGINDKPDYVLASRTILSYTVSALATYPFTVVETRMQNGDEDLKGKNFIEALQEIYNTEGVRGLYKGLFFN